MHILSEAVTIQLFILLNACWICELTLTLPHSLPHSLPPSLPPSLSLSLSLSIDTAGNSPDNDKLFLILSVVVVAITMVTVVVVLVVLCVYCLRYQREKAKVVSVDHLQKENEYSSGTRSTYSIDTPIHQHSHPSRTEYSVRV